MLGPIVNVLRSPLALKLTVSHSNKQAQINQNIQNREAKRQKEIEMATLRRNKRGQEYHCRGVSIQ